MRLREIEPESMMRRRSFRSLFVRSVVAMASGVVAVALLPSGGVVEAAEPKPLFEHVGNLERFPADARALLGEQLVPRPGTENSFQAIDSGTLIAVPKARLVLQVFRHPTNQPTTGVAVRDLDDSSLRIVRTLRLSVTLQRSTISSGGEWAHAVDDSGTRLWLLENGRQAVQEVGLRDFQVTRRPLPGQIISTSLTVAGLTYDRFADDLLVLYGGPGASSSANANTVLYRLDVSKPAPSSFPPAELARLYRFRSCTGPISSADLGGETYGWEILVAKEHLFVPCQRAGNTVVVVRTARPEADTDPATHREDVTVGPVWGDAVLADQKGGRLYATTVYGKEIWVYEAATASFVGVVASGPTGTNLKTAYGVDPETGRVFFQSPTFGLGVVEGRFFPVPQARTIPRRTLAEERIWSDEATGRVLVLEGREATAAGETKARAYRIYRTAPAPVPPSPPDPDRNTTDTDERPGVVEARYNASGSGYGTRVLWAGGYATVAPAPTVGTTGPTTGPMNSLFANQNPNFHLCGKTDRDLFAGRVAKAEYDTGSTSAKAVAVAVDNTTEQDLNQGRCPQGGAKVAWDHKAAECASNEGNVPDKPSHGAHASAPDLGPSTVSCPAPGGVLTAEAETEAMKLGVEVQRSRTTTRTERTGAGAVSTVEATAEGIRLALPGDLGVLSIGEIRSKAVSAANGRPKRRDMSTHEITIGDVRLGGASLCEETGCDPVRLEERLNVLSGGRAVFRTGHGPNSGRDEALVEGSDRGAQTAVQKSTARQASDRALVGDYTVEVPALEVTVFNDTTEWGRARQLYQFAGVASSATYNVVVSPTAIPFDDLGGLADKEGTAVAADVSDSPYEGLVEAVGDDPMSYTGLPAVPAVGVSGSDHDTGGVVAAVRAVARGLRLFLTSPRTALLLLSAWALLGSPAVLSRRRRLLADLRSG